MVNVWVATFSSLSFQIFTSVVIFGLFHGLAFLPVILSVVGPPPYDTQSFHTPPPSPTNIDNKDTHGEAVALRGLYTEEVDCVTTPNGHMRRSVSERDLEDDPTNKLNENNPRVGIPSRLFILFWETLYNARVRFTDVFFINLLYPSIHKMSVLSMRFGVTRLIKIFRSDGLSLNPD